MPSVSTHTHQAKLCNYTNHSCEAVLCDKHKLNVISVKRRPQRDSKITSQQLWRLRLIAIMMCIIIQAYSAITAAQHFCAQIRNSQHATAVILY